MSTAVLLSGGLDSAVLVAEEAARDDIQPIYVSVGLAWEISEREMAARFLASASLGPRVRPLVSLAVDMTDVYPAAHWALQGRPPGYYTPDGDVYLLGRNIVLLGKAGIYCTTAGIDRIALGTLGHNPFPDATPAFRSAMASALSLGLAHALTIDAPYASISKADVIRKGVALHLPLELTLSCMNPVVRSADASDSESGTSTLPRHCGLCSKCRERHDAFVEADRTDPTDYADRLYTN
jgi:7-cyano-7-deazaguanine synthase